MLTSVSKAGTCQKAGTRNISPISRFYCGDKTRTMIDIILFFSNKTINESSKLFKAVMSEFFFRLFVIDFLVELNGKWSLKSRWLTISLIFLISKQKSADLTIFWNLFETFVIWKTTLAIINFYILTKWDLKFKWLIKIFKINFTKTSKKFKAERF